MVKICYQRLKNGQRKIKGRVVYNYQFRNPKTGLLEKDPARLEKLNAIKIPDSYTEIEICYNWSQDEWRATGVDGTGQTQYFYCAEHWVESKKRKLSELVALGENLPRIVREIERLLDSREPYLRVLDALALKIVMLCHFRIGNHINRERNQTYGVTTLTRKHVKEIKSGRELEISFVGKKQQINQCIIKDEQVIWWLKWLMARRKNDQVLLGYKDYQVTSDSVNKFLQDFDPELSAKVWRTWFANAYFVSELIESSQKIPNDRNDRQQLITDVVKELAKKMHHTPAINKQSYLIKDLPEIYLNAPKTWSKLSDLTKNSTDFLMAYLDYHQPDESDDEK